MSIPNALRSLLSRPLILLIAFVFQLQAVLILMPQSSVLATDGFARYTKISSDNKKLYAAAARDYFANEASAYNAPCKPENVKISYYDGRKRHDGKENAYAYVDTLLGGYKKIPLTATYNDPSITQAQWQQTIIGFRNDPNGLMFGKYGKVVKTPGYCTVYWNTDPRDAQNVAEQCYTFVHEYGHLIGRMHTVDSRSVMYVGYAKDDYLYRPSREVSVDNVGDKTLCATYDALQSSKEKKVIAKQQAAEAKAAAKKKKAENKAAAKKKKADNKKITLSSGEIAGICIKTANPQKIGSTDRYAPNNGPKDVKWRKRACKDGAKIGVKDYKANNKTDGACYKKGRKKEVQDVCDYGRYAAIDKLDEKYGHRSIN